ncbi:MAG: endonuclease domain-containing protein [Solirubrobacteraceae bacterium MAG38_C4-C5]|nr:endonuclease domain-containing protein [Candidatus Siliceabacter maunaloa]
MEIARRAASEWSVLCVEELYACGLKPDAIAARVANGRLHPMYRGVYAVGHAKPPLEGFFLAAVKACGPGTVLSHYAAAAFWQFVRWDDRDLEVTVVGSASRIHQGIRVHRTLSLDARDRRRHQGIPVTSPASTLLDLAGTRISDERLRRALREALARKRVNIPQLVEILARLPRRRGARRLATIVAAGVPTRSEQEDATLDLLLGGGLAHPDVNRPLILSGRRVIPDFRWPQQRLVVEADGAAWHDNPLARADDAERQKLLEAHGERVVRVSWEQVFARPRPTFARVAAAGAPYSAAG